MCEQAEIICILSHFNGNWLKSKTYLVWKFIIEVIKITIIWVPLYVTLIVPSSARRFLQDPSINTEKEEHKEFYKLIPTIENIQLHTVRNI